MFYQSELHFLCGTLEKCHVRARIAAFDDPISTVIDAAFLPFYAGVIPFDSPISSYLPTANEGTMYKFTGMFGFSYIYFILPDSEEKRYFIMGPYLGKRPSGSEVLEIAERSGVSPKNLRAFEGYYESVPIIPESSHIFPMLDTFGERIWCGAPFSIIDIDKELQFPTSPLSGGNSESFDATLVSMKTMEQRYDYEKEIMLAITHGQLHKMSSLLSSFDMSNFEKRVSDPLRNLKNYCIIMNTLFRKAAQDGGVHPIYLDRISSEFAVKIEQLPTASDAAGLMREMFRGYCRLVRKHSLKDYSPVVQKAILLIDADLSADLTLSTLANEQKISAGYLSTVFKKEVGMTVTQFIKEKRLKYAVHLLNTTSLQIQTIALHCGILDVQYFSKMFKKYTGKSPSEYREAARE